MGKLRLWVEACVPVEETFNLPAHWEELDDDEKSDYIGEKLGAFVTKHVQPKYSVSE